MANQSTTSNSATKSISQTTEYRVPNSQQDTSDNFSGNQHCTCNHQSKCGDSKEERYHYNFDPRDILLVGCLEKDTAQITNQQEIMKHVWQKGRPPRNISERNPVVSARQLELIRGQIYGRIKVRRHKP